MLFKILVDNQSCHGGNYNFPPIGKWTEPINPVLCSAGYHLTSDPLRWWKPKAKLYLAEGKGKVSSEGDDKIAFESVRLIQEVTRDFPHLEAYPRIRAFLAASERSLNPKVDIWWADLCGANLSQACFKGVNFSDVNLVGTNLSGANFEQANLFNAKLTESNLSCAYFYRTNLSRANLVAANLSYVTMIETDLSNASLNIANISNISFDLDSNFCNTDFSRCEIFKYQKDFFEKIGWSMDNLGRLYRTQH